jgi:large repetitive protein
VSVANGRLVYKPAANLSGQEVISYVLRESNGGTTSGNVTFNITNVNDAPVAVADTLSVNSTVGNSAINVLANDTDPDTADNLVISSITQPETGKGTLAISGDQKTINYTPPSNTFEGSFSFSYTVRDTAGLTSTTTANITVQRFTPRAIAGKVMLSNAGLKQIQVTLSGTTSSGTPITQTATSNSDGSFSFGELAPGNYKLKRDALPFLNDQSQEVTIQSGPNDGNHTADLQVSGSLHSKYVDVRDFLGSSRRKTLTAVINNSTGATRWIAPKGDWANLSTLGFQVNTNDLTLNAANATASNLTAKVPFTNTLLSRTTEGDVTLVRLRGASTKFNLAAPTTQSSSSTLEAEGESATSAVSSSQANPVTTSQIPSTSGATNNSMLQSILGSSRRRSNSATSADNTTQSGSSDSNQS